MKSVYILLADGFEDVEATAPFDVLRRGGVNAVFVGVTGKNVTSSHGMVVECDIIAAEADQGAMEAVVLPGGGKGVENLAASERVTELVKYAFERGLVAAAICAAPSVFGRLGYLGGKRFTCYPSYERYAPDGIYSGSERAVTDGQIVTGKAAGASLDFAFALLEKLRGAEIADAVRAKMYY